MRSTHVVTVRTSSTPPNSLPAAALTGRLLGVHPGASRNCAGPSPCRDCCKLLARGAANCSMVKGAHPDTGTRKQTVARRRRPHSVVRANLQSRAGGARVTVPFAAMVFDLPATARPLPFVNL